MVKIPCRLPSRVNHRFLTDGKDTWNFLISNESLKFEPEFKINPTGAQVVGDGVLLLENGLDPGSAGFISDLKEVEYLNTHPAIAGHLENALRLICFPLTAPKSE
jgi:hypothetical protein